MFYLYVGELPSRDGFRGYLDFIHSLYVLLFVLHRATLKGKTQKE